VEAYMKKRRKRKSLRLGEIIKSDNKYKKKLRRRFDQLEQAVKKAIKKYPDLKKLKVPLKDTGCAVEGLAYGMERVIISPQCADEMAEYEEDEDTARRKRS
jgi:hypothetical protein